MSDAPKVHKLFATPLLEKRLANAGDLNAALARVIAERKNASPGVQRSNIHGWHSDSDMLRWGGEAAKTLAIETLQLCAAYTHDTGMREGQPRFESGIEMWANISPAGASNQMHSHPGALWSAVYYVDDGGDAEGGPLMLLDPRYPMNRMYAPDLVFADRESGKEENMVRVAPEPGKIVAFPSWLTHGVKAHSGPRDRISIAMNVLAIPVRPQPPGRATN